MCGLLDGAASVSLNILLATTVVIATFTREEFDEIVLQDTSDSNDEMSWKSSVESDDDMAIRMRVQVHSTLKLDVSGKKYSITYEDFYRYQEDTLPRVIHLCTYRKWYCVFGV